MSFEALDVAAEVFEPEVVIPSIESLEALSGAVLTPTALAYLLRQSKKKYKSKSVRRRFDKMAYTSRVRTPRSRAPARARTRTRAGKVNRMRRAPRRPIVARVHRNYISGGGNTMRQIRVVKRLQVPRGTSAASRKNLQILDFDQPTVGTSEYAFHYEFSLNDMYDDASFKAIYQYYKILGVRVIFYPLQNAHLAAAQSNSTNPIRSIVASATATSGSAPRIVVAPDAVSVTDFSNESDALAHDNSRFHVFNDGSEFSIWTSPKPLDIVGREGVLTSKAPGRSQWLPTDSDGAAVLHRGIRGYVSNLHSAIQMRVMWEFKIAFRGLKA